MSFLKAGPSPIVQLPLPSPSDDQQAVLRTLVEWINNPRGRQEMTLGGYAGTGKSTCVRHLADRCRAHRPRVCALAGKAVHVLRSKGLAAHTIHSSIYDATKDSEGTWHYHLKNPAELEDVDYFIVDESSMVSRSLYDDILSFDKKVLWVGDHGQLEPIGDNPNLLQDPDLRLEVIHRQAAENPILRFAQALRRGEPWTETDKDPRLILDSRNNAGAYIAEVDQVIVAFNATRFKLNKMFRDHYGRSKSVLTPGERVICLRNNKDLGIFNGMQGIVRQVVHESEKLVVADVRVDDGRELKGIRMLKAQFHAKSIDDIKVHTDAKLVALFDYAYAITCHKSQGSEWGKVLVVEEACDLWSMKRWSYTAATRAAQQLVYCR